MMIALLEFLLSKYDDTWSGEGWLSNKKGSIRTERLLREKLASLNVKGLSDELLAKRPQLYPVVAVRDMRGDLLFSNRIVVQISAVGLFNSRVYHGGDERSRSLGCASERRQSDRTAVEITQCCFKGAVSISKSGFQGLNLGEGKLTFSCLP
jgi:hypothetical protein